jgi:DNA-binding NarL/FixJ family response regulator
VGNYVRILIGDDHTLVRQGFRKILEARPEWEVVAEASDGRDAVRQALATEPREVLLQPRCCQGDARRLRSTLGREGNCGPVRSLSEREREIFQLIAEGHSNRAIAELLAVSPATVETHRVHILQKLDVHNTAELALYAVRHGVIS